MKSEIIQIKQRNAQAFNTFSFILLPAVPTFVVRPTPKEDDNQKVHTTDMPSGDHRKDHNPLTLFPEISKTLGSPCAGSGTTWNTQTSVSLEAAGNTTPSQS